MGLEKCQRTYLDCCLTHCYLIWRNQAPAKLKESLSQQMYPMRNYLHFIRTSRLNYWSSIVRQAWKNKSLARCKKRWNHHHQWGKIRCESVFVFLLICSLSAISPSILASQWRVKAPSCFFLPTLFKNMKICAVRERRWKKNSQLQKTHILSTNGRIHTLYWNMNKAGNMLLECSQLM